MKLKASLYEMIGVGLIIPCKSGCIYSNQTGGGACFQPEMEGVFVPVNFDCLPEIFSDTVEYKLSQIFLECEKVDFTRAEAIDTLLASRYETRGISVDRQRLEQSMEAWVYVDVEPAQSSPIECDGPLKGVLTWPNSD